MVRYSAALGCDSFECVNFCHKVEIIFRQIGNNLMTSHSFLSPLSVNWLNSLDLFISAHSLLYSSPNWELMRGSNGWNVRMEKEIP